MRLPETDDEAEDRRKDIRRRYKDAGKRLRSFARYGDLASVLQLLPEGVYAFCAGSHPRLGAASRAVGEKFETDLAIIVDGIEPVSGSVTNRPYPLKLF